MTLHRGFPNLARLETRSPETPPERRRAPGALSLPGGSVEFYLFLTI
jgi:hypothetical protein